jgi:hypothetical protein
MNTQNIPKQNIVNNIDYYKDLKDINKEIAKIYKQLSKDETFTDILENIKTDFIKNNISIIEDNLSKPTLTNYKDFNGKIIKMLEILNKLLTNYTSYKDNSKIYQGIIDTIYVSINAAKEKAEKEAKEKAEKDAKEAAEKAEKEGKAVPAQLSVTNFKRLSQEELNNLIDINPSFKDLKQTKSKDAAIVKNICMFKYYLEIFEKNDPFGKDLDDKIKDTNNTIANLIKNGAENRKSNDNNDYNLLIREKENLKNYHISNKKIYKELCDYIQLATFDIFENLSEAAEAAATTNTDKNEKPQAKEKTDNSVYVEKFKNDIYYEIININNAQVNDDYAKLKDNSNEKIDLDLRKKTLAEMKELLDKQLNKLHGVIEYIVSSRKEEYSTEITDIRKTFKDYSKEKEYKDSILTLIVNEETEVNKLLARNSDDKKRLEAASKQKGGEKKSNKYYADKYAEIKVLNNKICNLLKKIKEFEGIEDNDDPFEKKSTTMFGDASEGVNSIYKRIWNDYIKDTRKTKSKGITVENLKIDTRLYERFKENDLDPNDILKISFQDKIIFICIILIIRTFAMVLIEFLIEYNIVSTLYRGIVIYSVLYILLLICGILIINYDSYKLRILVNYLNIHINSSNIFFHILLFILFIGLILIIINNNDANKIDIDNVLNYTYIYKYLYEIAEKSKPMSDLKLSQKEKVKLQYRMDIITMIIFIFSSLLILIM